MAGKVTDSGYLVLAGGVPAGSVEVRFLCERTCTFVTVDTRVMQDMRESIDRRAPFAVSFRCNERVVVILTVPVDKVSEQVRCYLTVKLHDLFERMVIDDLKYGEIAFTTSTTDICCCDVEPAGFRRDILFGESVRAISQEPAVGCYRVE